MRKVEFFVTLRQSSSIYAVCISITSVDLRYDYGICGVIPDSDGDGGAASGVRYALGGGDAVCGRQRSLARDGRAV